MVIGRNNLVRKIHASDEDAAGGGTVGRVVRSTFCMLILSDQCYQKQILEMKITYHALRVIRHHEDIAYCCTVEDKLEELKYGFLSGAQAIGSQGVP